MRRAFWFPWGQGHLGRIAGLGSLLTAQFPETGVSQLLLHTHTPHSRVHTTHKPRLSVTHTLSVLLKPPEGSCHTAPRVRQQGDPGPSEEELRQSPQVRAVSAPGTELPIPGQSKRLPVRFPLRAHAWAAGQVPGRGRARGSHTLMLLSHTDVPLPFSLPSSVSRDKYFFKKNDHLNFDKCPIQVQEGRSAVPPSSSAKPSICFSPAQLNSVPMERSSPAPPTVLRWTKTQASGHKATFLAKQGRASGLFGCPPLKMCPVTEKH